MKQLPFPVVIGAVGVILVLVVMFVVPAREAQAPMPDMLTPVASTATPRPPTTPGTENPGANVPAFDASAGDPAKVMVTLSNTSLRVPDQTVRVSLRGGAGSFTEGPVRGNVTLVSVLASRKTPDGSYDAFANVVSDTGGSGTFQYLVLFRLTAQTIEDTSYVFVGDRVQLVSATPGPDTANGYQLAVTYLDRAPNEPLSAAPTVSKQVTFAVQGHKISKQ